MARNSDHEGKNINLTTDHLQNFFLSASLHICKLMLNK